MADTKTPRKRVGDYNPDAETGETLDVIAGQDVTITGVQFERRNGQNGRYTLSIIALDNDEHPLVHTGSAIIADKLAGLFGLSGDALVAELDAGAPSPAAANVFPVDANFHLVASQSRRGQSYWTVE